MSLKNELRKLLALLGRPPKANREGVPGLPVSLAQHFNTHYHHAESEASASATDIALVTAFFDIGRAIWPRRAYPRSTEEYFGYFDNLAGIRNHLVVLCEQSHADRILSSRLERAPSAPTTILTVPSLFDLPEVAKAHASVAKVLADPEFRRFVFRPNLPEFSYPRYDIVTGLKPCFVQTAIDLGTVTTPQTAWIDFGYCRDGNGYDPASPWRFDAMGKINLFHLHEFENRSIARIVQRNKVFIMGGRVVGPTAAWRGFAEETNRSFTELLSMGLADDDQTLWLMNLRRHPERYQTTLISNWFTRLVDAGPS